MPPTTCGTNSDAGAGLIIDPTMLADVVRQNGHLNGRRREVIEENLSRLLYNETRRRPMVFSVINEV